MSEFAAAIRRTTARLKRASLSRKYDPNQPRVPVGNPDGGQWTDGDGGPASPRSSPRRTAVQRREASAASGWALLAREKIAGGERTLHAVSGGVLIASERRTGAFTAARTSIHSVRMPDGSGLRIETDRTGVQRIFDERGNLLAATRWGRNGPEVVAAARLAGGTIELRLPMPPLLPALSLFNKLVAEIPSGQPVLSFRAREFSPTADGRYDVEYVGEITMEQADAACLEYPHIRSAFEYIQEETRRTFSGPGSRFGIEVHQRMKEYINGLKRDDLFAEVSVNQDGANVDYGTAGSSRFDAFELLGADTVCVYDHKTGGAELSLPRAQHLGRLASRRFRSVRRFIVIEIKTRK
jgi:hypothetical protein